MATSLPNGNKKEAKTTVTAKLTPLHEQYHCFLKADFRYLQVVFTGS